jgi:hypothetical protein
VEAIPVVTPDGVVVIPDIRNPVLAAIDHLNLVAEQRRDSLPDRLVPTRNQPHPEDIIQKCMMRAETMLALKAEERLKLIGKVAEPEAEALVEYLGRIFRA